jgi:hypothetical protein
MQNGSPSAKIESETICARCQTGDEPWRAPPSFTRGSLRPGYLELLQTDQNTYGLLFKILARGEDLRLAVYVNLPEGTLDIGAPRVSFGDGAYDASPAATDDHVKVACNIACVSAQSKPAS